MASPYRSNGAIGKCRGFGQGNLNTNGVRAVNLSRGVFAVEQG